MRRLAGGYFGASIALIAVAIAVVGCGGGASTQAEEPTADAGRFHTCATQELGVDPESVHHFPTSTKALADFGLSGSRLGEESKNGAIIGLTDGFPDALIYASTGEARAGATKAEATGLVAVRDENVIWVSEGQLPANWETLLHNCVGESTRSS